VTDAPAPGHDPHRAARKDDHVRLAEDQVNAGFHRNEFDDLTFVHHALGGVSASEVDLAANLGPWRFATPFYVNGMTGGTDMTARINRDLAIAARAGGFAGSTVPLGDIAQVAQRPGLQHHSRGFAEPLQHAAGPPDGAAHRIGIRAAADTGLEAGDQVVHARAAVGQEGIVGHARGLHARHEDLGGGGGSGPAHQQVQTLRGG